jgi:hypothetical protein
MGKPVLDYNTPTRPRVVARPARWFFGGSLVGVAMGLAVLVVLDPGIAFGSPMGVFALGATWLLVAAIQQVIFHHTWTHRLSAVADGLGNGEGKLFLAGWVCGWVPFLAGLVRNDGDVPWRLVLGLGLGVSGPVIAALLLQRKE